MNFTIASHNNERKEDGFSTIEDEFVNLPKYILANGYCSNVVKNGSRKMNSDKSKPTGIESYMGGEDVLILDVDDGITLVQAQACFKKYNFIIITTKKHQKYIDGIQYGDRFRVLIQLKYRIDNYEERKKIIEGIFKTYFFVDKQTKNANRFFYASPKDAIIIYNIHEKDHLFDANDFLSLIDMTPKKIPTEPVKDAQISTSAHPEGIYAWSELQECYINEWGEVLEGNHSGSGEESKLNGISKYLDENFYQGNKSNCLFNSSCIMVSDGFDDDFIIDYLMGEWEIRKSGKERFSDALKNCKGGLKTR